MKAFQPVPDFLQPVSIGLLVICLAFSIMVSGQQGSLTRQLQENDAKANGYLEEGKKNAAAQLYNQSAYMLRSANRLTEAAAYYEKVLQINVELGNRRGQLSSHNSLAMVYLEAENYPKAIFHLQKELAFRKEINNKAEIINVMANLALAQNEMSGFDSAIENIETAINYARELNDLALMKRCYGVAYDIYEKIGNTEKSHAYFELYSAIDKKIKEQKMTEITTEAKRIVNVAESEKQLTQQELSKKSEELDKTVSTLQEAEELTREQKMEIELQQANLREKDALLEAKRIRERYLITGLIVTSIFIAVLIFLVLKIRNANKKINQQRLWLERQNKEIRASIRYAQTIQQAILPNNSALEQFFDPFILFLPKDIVSGDFYWFHCPENSTNDTVYFSVIDCTGHGVPGAFMSMIGNRLLNEIVTEKKIESPADILAELNVMIRDALRQEETDNNDGMDLAFCKMVRKKKNLYTLTFSGAKRPIYIIKNKENKLITHRGDRKSIGGYNLSKREIVFTNYEVDVEAGDMIYLFSDGIVDQNSPERKKFGRLRLEEAMADCANLRAGEQKVIFRQRLADYMQNEEQRDDITVMGLKILEV
jgi:serine phosphatase RsbU (regulator of sigma subunit)